MINELEGVIVTVNDMRTALIKDSKTTRYCSNGTRAFAKHHNLNIRDFIINGIPAINLYALNDAMAMKVIAAAIKRTKEEQQ